MCVGLTATCFQSGSTSSLVTGALIFSSRRTHALSNLFISIETSSVGVVGTGPEATDDMETADIVVILYEPVCSVLVVLYCRGVDCMYKEEV